MAARAKGKRTTIRGRACARPDSSFPDRTWHGLPRLLTVPALALCLFACGIRPSLRASESIIDAPKGKITSIDSGATKLTFMHIHGKAPESEPLLKCIWEKGSIRESASYP